MNEDWIEHLKKSILDRKKPSKVTIDKKEIVCKCPYCGDSQNSSHGHFYIKLSPPFSFYCFKCTEKGILTNRVLRDLGIDEPDLFIILADINNEYKLSSESQARPVNIDVKLNIRAYNNETSRKNLKYIEDRFNLKFTEEYIAYTYKCILDPPTFFIENDIKTKMNFNFKDAVGFVSNDNSHINFRDTSNLNPLRYIIMTLDETGTKICLTRENIDILKPTINVYMAEGIFDIIGLRESLQDVDDEGSIFVAACGKSYIRAIKAVTEKGFLNLNINIYSDSDVNSSFFKYLKDENDEFKYNKTRLFYNKLGKDFGVPKKDIELQMGVL